MQHLKNERTIVMATQLLQDPTSHQLFYPETDSDELVKRFLKVIIIQLLYRNAAQQKMA